MEGNGHSRVNIVTYAKAPGYIIVSPDRIDNLPEQTPIFVSQTLEAWQRQNPSCRVRCTCPIVHEGQTIAVHVWYDVVDVPDGAPPPPPADET
jgi:hypothetical protein